ncbi:hypothetical protein AA0118_g12782 [Alternaria tenuissima]|nr:hypothetical protein AA0118_g12782 [Alternaria tenuissima]
MAGNLIFITGATGFVGFAALTDALQQGYTARVSVRQAAQIDKIKEHDFVKPFVQKGAVQFAVVPDITIPGAFDQALKDVTEDPEKDIILPAIQGTTSILYSALKHPSIKRIVITSSVVALLDGKAFTVGDDTTIYTPDLRRTPLPTAPFHPQAAYLDSKALALHATDEFILKNSPHFTIVNVMPGLIVGRSKIATKSGALMKTTNSVPLSIVLGTESIMGASGMIAHVVHIDDVARIHVAALDTKKVPGNRSFLLQSSDGGKVVFEDALVVAKDKFGDAIEEGLLPLGGTLGSLPINVDSKETEEVFGPLKTYKEAVENALEQFVELKRKELAM